MISIVFKIIIVINLLAFLCYSIPIGSDSDLDQDDGLFTIPTTSTTTTAIITTSQIPFIVSDNNNNNMNLMAHLVYR